MVYGSNLSNHYHAPYKLKKITDIPVTCFKRIGYKSQLWSITGVSSFETKALLQQAYHQDYDFVMIITHPFEFVTTKGKPLRGNQARLIHLCQYVKNNPDKFIFANDLNLLSVVSDKILKSNPLRYLKSLLESKIFEIY